MTSKVKTFFSTISFFWVLSIASLVACTNVGFKAPEPEKEPVSILTGKSGGTKLSDLKNVIAGSKQYDSMPVNALLWRAALDIASFVPLDDVDTFGGSIVTEWYQSADQPNQRLKLSFFVTGLELRSDAITVQAYLQKRAGDRWVDAGRNDQLARQLENLVLTRARELRAASLSETIQ
jgi:hypothetical protein